MKSGQANFLLILVIFTSCQSTTIKEYNDTPVSGEIKISVDETFQPIIDSEIFTFQSLYTRAKIVPAYVSEASAFKDLLNDSCRLIIVTRELNNVEKKFFGQIPIRPRTTKIATDAIAFIIHPENTDSVFRYEEIVELFKGNLKRWSDHKKDSEQEEIHVVFDNSNSSTARYLKEQIAVSKELPSNCYALQSNEEVIRFCSENRNALGVIGVNWISDGDDPASLRFKQHIKVVGIIPPETSESPMRPYKPYQAYIAQKLYPFTRDVFIISREARSGLGSGFSSFVAGDKGQRIILKSGIMPAIKPVRIVGFRENE